MTMAKWLKRYTICTIWLTLTLCSHIYYVAGSWINELRSKSITATQYEEITEVMDLLTVKNSTAFNESITSIKQATESKYEEIAEILLAVENWTFNLAAIFNILGTYFTSREIPAMVGSLQKVEKWIKSVIGVPKTSKIRKNDLKKSVFWIVPIYSIFFITVGVEYSNLFPTHRDGNFINIILQDLGKLSMTTYDLQFSNFCIVLTSRFYRINKILSSIGSSIEISTFSTIIFKTIPRLRFSNIRLHHPPIGKINSIHMTLCDVITSMISLLQIQITLNIAVCFFNTVSVLFTTISEYRANTNWTLWISGLLWVTYYILRVIMVCTLASGVIEQVYQSRIYLSNLKSQNLNEVQKYQTEIFLQRLTNTDIKFILMNLMTINTGFLGTAGIVITTYLVITLQYTYTSPYKSQGFVAPSSHIMNSHNPKDVFFRSFSVAYYFSKIFGAMPFKIDKSNTTTGRSKWCRIGITLSIIYIVFVISSIIFTNELSNMTKYKKKKLYKIHDKTQMVVAPMFIWSLYISHVFAFASFAVLPFTLGELNSVFRKFRQLANSSHGILLFGDGTKAEKMAENVKKNTWRIIILYIILAVSSAISSFNRIRLSASVNFVVMLDVVTKKMEALSVCLGFCAICDILLHCFYSVNDNLTALKLRRKESPNRLVYPLLNEMIPPTDQLLKSLSHCHTELCDIIQQVNRIYQIQNLFGISICVLKILPHLFLTGIILTFSNFHIIHSSFFLWPAQYLYRIFIICKSAAKVTNEAMKSYHHVSALYEEDIDENSKQQVVLFMEKMDSRTIQFSLCGLCKLDSEGFFSNLLTTVGGIFIIILQSYMTQIENWPKEVQSEWEGQT